MFLKMTAKLKFLLAHPKMAHSLLVAVSLLYEDMKTTGLQFPSFCFWVTAPKPCEDVSQMHLECRIKDRESWGRAQFFIFLV